MADPRPHATRFVSTLALALLVAAAAPVAATDETVTWSGEVAPILFQNCVKCHRPGEIAPMSLLSYEDARPWAKSMKRKVSQRLMPPWGASREHGTWVNDMSLSDEEIATIVRWVDQGAPEGDPAAIPAAPTFRDGWQFGAQPDHVIELDPVEVAAGGEDLFLDQLIELELDSDRWIRAIEFLPGQRRVTHHFLATYTTGRASATGRGEDFDTSQGGSGILGVWTAGMQPISFPAGMGRVLGRKSRILVNSHYHPSGQATVDRTKIGLYFGEGPLAKEVTNVAAINTGLRIPPKDPSYAVSAFFVFDENVRLTSFSPHMHMRGKAMRYDLVYPDGRRQTVLDVPRYNYNYQWMYYPTESIAAPAGSKLEVTATWDNSEGNLANPDPEAEIIYRGDVFKEMFVGFFEYVSEDSVHPKVLPPQEKLAKLLAAHPPDDAYLVSGMIPLGLYAPRTGQGMVYLVNGTSMTTVSLDDVRWEGQKLTIHTTFPTADADGLSTLIEGELDEQGRLTGKLHYGIQEEQAGEKPAMHLPFVATTMSASGSDSTGAGAGGH